MKTGELNKVLIFYPETQTQGSDGYFTNAEGTGKTLRGKVTQISGYRKMVYTELVNQEVYEVVLFDNSVITKNAKVVYNGKTLYIHSIVDLDDKSSTGVKKLIIHTK